MASELFSTRARNRLSPRARNELAATPNLLSEHIDRARAEEVELNRLKKPSPEIHQLDGRRKLPTLPEQPDDLSVNPQSPPISGLQHCFDRSSDRCAKTQPIRGAAGQDRGHDFFCVEKDKTSLTDSLPEPATKRVQFRANQPLVPGCSQSLRVRLRAEGRRADSCWRY